MPEHAVVFPSDEQTLAGTLTVPERPGPFPAVVCQRPVLAPTPRLS